MRLLDEYTDGTVVLPHKMWESFPYNVMAESCISSFNWRSVVVVLLTNKSLHLGYILLMIGSLIRLVCSTGWTTHNCGCQHKRCNHNWSRKQRKYDCASDTIKRYNLRWISAQLTPCWLPANVITCTIVDWWSVRSCDINLEAISHEML